MAHQDRTNIAVFVDFDNIEIGVKTTLGEHFDVGCVLEAIKERGEVVTKIAYADWTRAGDYSRHLTQHAIRLVQRNLTPGGDKNGADINLALDALEMAFTHPHINAYVIVGGDSDFLSLVEKLKQYDKKVFVVGGRAFTSVILQRNCHEFIAYENLTGGRRVQARGGKPAAAAASTPVAQAIPIVRRALKILSDREVSPQTGLLKSTLLQLDSTFSERNYGASSFLDFVEKLAQAGVVSLKHSGRSVMVELNPAFTEDSEGFKAQAAAQADAPPPAPQQAEPPPQSQSHRGGDEHAGSAPAAPAGPPAGTNAEGAARAGRILAAATSARWPMYLRNVKQILRQHRDAATGEPFDERRYGFGGLMELLKALQREGVVRIERDRRGGIRVFQGGQLQSHTPPQRPAAPHIFDIEDELREQEQQSVETIESQPGEPIAASEPAETEQPELEPMPIDTTAELLGRAKPKRTAAAPGRRRAARAAEPAGTRKATGTKKTTTRRPRARKAAASDGPDTE